MFDWRYFWSNTNVGDRNKLNCSGFAENFHIPLILYAVRKCQFPYDFHWSEIGAVGFELWLMTASSNNFDSFSLKRRRPARKTKDVDIGLNLFRKLSLDLPTTCQHMLIVCTTEF